jgi:hypothetical protein
MTESDKIRGIIESAVESAFIDFPNIGPGETWPQHYKENAECKTLARAVVSSLEKWGYKIVPMSVPDENADSVQHPLVPANAGTQITSCE